MSDELFAFMPVYNEAESIGRVVEEWLPALQAATKRFTLCCLDDGSRDATPAILDALAAAHPEMRVVHKANTGHGATCREGYRLALASGAAWIFQLDSDGQCDPAFFADLWDRRQEHDAVFGFRRVRDDGAARRVISSVLRGVTWAATGVRVRDANVPYRLMHRAVLAPALDAVPEDVELVNVALAVQVARRRPIDWREIRFRERSGGTASLRLLDFARIGARSFAQLRRLPR